MILKRIRNLVNEFRSQNTFITQQVSELEWAHIYHDTIRGKKWLEDLGISPGRWAGNYSFLYLLTRILIDYKPHAILEFGLGESSKVISSFLDNELQESKHLIIEQSKEWIDNFNSRFLLSKNSHIVQLDLEIKCIHDKEFNGYYNIETQIQSEFDLYVIDGPFGSERFSRYDVCFLADCLKIENEFIIIIDDYNRPGEKETSIELIALLKKKGFNIFTGVYSGSKSQIVITTEGFQYATSM